MKKRFKLYFILFLLFILVGCDSGSNNELNKNDEVGKKEYTVSFITGCEMEINDLTVKEGETIPFIPTPVQDGYVFSRWDKDVTKPITEDTTFNAIWQLANYTITYHTDETMIFDNPATFTMYDTIVLNECNKDGFIFEGWFSDEELTHKVERIKKGTVEDVELFPKFTEVTYSITYSLDGGVNNANNPTSYKASNQNTIYLLPATKEDYSFVGWYKEESFLNLITTIEPSSVTNYTLFARFTKDSLATSNIKFNLNGGEVDIDHNFDYSSKICEANATMFLVYDTQKGEYASVSDKLGNLYFYYICVNKTDVIDMYQIVDIAYKSTDVTVESFDYCIAWHGSLLDTESKQSLLSIYNSREGMIGGYVEMEYMPEEKSSKCDIELTFYPKTAYSTNYIRYKNPVVLPIPTKEGSTFLGWVSSVDGQKVTSYPGYYDSKTITYTAQWIKNEFVGTNIQAAVEDINSLMSKNYLVEEDISLPTSLYGCTITWESLTPDYIDNTGKVYRTPISREATLLAKVTDNNNEENIAYSFTIKGKFHDLDNGIKAGYFYFSDSKVSDYNFRNLDIMYIAFGVPTADGSIGDLEHRGNLINKNFVKKAHPNGVRVLLSINTSNCSTIAANQALTDKFAETLVKFVQTYELDGIDLDWEWPASDEVTNFTRLCKAIKTRLIAANPDYLLTAAVGSYQSSRYDLKNSGQYLDYISIMTYDMQVGSYSSFQSAIHYAQNKGTYNIDTSVKNYSAVYPANRISLGIPFYARVWNDSKGPATRSTYKGATSYSYVYTNYITKGKEFWDDECEVPYVYDEATGYFAAYDNPKSIAIKAAYVKSHGLAGLMYWEDSQDYGDVLVTAIVDEINKQFKE